MTILKAYKSKSLSISQMLQSVKQLFLKGSKNPLGLYEGFKEYVPRKHSNLYLEILSSMK